ncbi:MAG: hypothetical protein N3C12_04675 [Candidatus Binatia bacterium]|nr:hypothetical protein [Candidatus Binatia bacterium]
MTNETGDQDQKEHQKMKTRKFFSKVSATIGLAAALAAPMNSASAACTGDPNGGGISLADVSLMLTCINNPAAPACASACGGQGILDCADVNLDGTLNINDAVIVLNQTSPGCNRNVVPMCSSPGPVLPCGTTISQDITSNVVLGSCEYFLDGTVFVQPGSVVTIRPGAVIKGRKVSSDGSPSALVFLQGNCSTGNPFSARINAAGTPSSPIVFTSDQPVGSRQAGDWGGVSFQGCSVVNLPGGSGTPEGLVGVVFGGGATPILNESSGLARYVRAEFAGRELSPDNELNVWTMNALGSCTQFDWIQAHMGKDDGLEWFGGTVNHKYLVATANADDQLDWQLGTLSKVQFALGAQYAGNLDTVGSHGFESDNNENNFSATPISDPRFCNVTLIGADKQSGHPAGDFFALFHRRGTGGQLANVLVTAFQDAALQLRDAETGAHACGGTCLVAGNPRTNGVATCDGSPFSLTGAAAPILRHHKLLLFDNGTGGTELCRNKTGSGNTGARCNSCEYMSLLQAAGEVSTANPGLITAGAFPSPAVVDPRPGNPAAVAGGVDCGALFSDPFFDSATYIGAFDPSGTNWLVTPGGWISLVTQ